MGDFASANQLTLSMVASESCELANREAANLPLLPERKADPWEQPVLGKQQAQQKTSGNAGYSSGYSSYGGYSNQQSNNGYKSSSAYASNSIPGRVENICKNLNNAAKSLPSFHQPEPVQNDYIEREARRMGKRGFWSGVKDFLAKDSTKEVILIMSIITLKTALIVTYAKADQRKMKVAEFI